MLNGTIWEYEHRAHTVSCVSLYDSYRLIADKREASRLSIWPSWSWLKIYIYLFSNIHLWKHRDVQQSKIICLSCIHWGGWGWVGMQPWDITESNLLSVLYVPLCRCAASHLCLIIPTQTLVWINAMFPESEFPISANLSLDVQHSSPPVNLA